MADELRKQVDTEKQARESGDGDGHDPHLSYRFQKAERTFLKKLRGDFPGWHRTARLMRRLDRELREAGTEGPAEVREEARSAVRRRGLFGRLENKMEHQLDRELDELKEKGASKGALRLHKKQWWAQYRRRSRPDLDDVERLLRPRGRRRLFHF